MLLRISNAQLIRDDMWIVWLDDDNTNIMSIPAIDPPRSCPGGIWCKDFGCEGGVYE